METKALKKQLGAAIAMVLVAAIALGAATFAWFVNNNAVTATDVNVSTSSAVPNLYITNAGKTSDTMSTEGKNNPNLLYPVSTSDAVNFYETLHWTSGSGNHAVADQYQSAIAHENGKNVYADYTFKLGVANGTMDVYFDKTKLGEQGAATTLKANGNMGTAGRFAISFDNGKTWKLFKVSGTATGIGYYTDSVATEGDYWVTSDGNKISAGQADYADFNVYAGTINDKGQAVRPTRTDGKVEPLATISSDKEADVIVRVWYEGCDKDCVSENAGTNAGMGIANAITGNLGFVGVAV